MQFYLKSQVRNQEIKEHSENSLQKGEPGMGRGRTCIPWTASLLAWLSLMYSLSFCLPSTYIYQMSFQGQGTKEGVRKCESDILCLEGAQRLVEDD